MTKQEALILIEAKIKAAKALLTECSDLANENDISFSAGINSDVDYEKDDGSWTSSSYRC